MLFRSWGQAGDRAGETQVSRVPAAMIPPAPALSPEQALKTFKVQDGFRIELVASEPLVQSPVAIQFGPDGRLWVLEMRGFMPNVDGEGEAAQVGRISVLEDTNGDGRMDKSTVFLDQLVLPRAFMLLRDGVLVAEPPMLWFHRDTNGDGVADTKTLVSDSYAVEANPLLGNRANLEHSANSLTWALDNWIYSAAYVKKFRYVNGQWETKATDFRGQWGLSQDDYGRLFYNSNSDQLRADVVPAEYLSRNPNFTSAQGANFRVGLTQDVWPGRMNPGVNRGYQAGQLRDDFTLATFTAACAPMIYRGNLFPAAYRGNAFLCEPAGNLVRRNVLVEKDGGITATMPYKDTEFLVSTDERFRPVNLATGPDGAMYVVDLYRGILQHRVYVTSYLREQILSRELQTPVNQGRIYRVVPATANVATAPRPNLTNAASADLVGQLSHANGWWRDTAQRLLVERGDRSVVPALVQVVQAGSNPLARIHALWTLEGLLAELPAQATPTAETSGNMIKLYRADAKFSAGPASLPPGVLDALLKAVADADPKVQVAALRVAESLTGASAAGQRALVQAIAALPARTAEETLFQAALTAGNLPKSEALAVLVRIATQASGTVLQRDAVISGLQDFELPFLQALLADPQWATSQAGRPAMLQALAGAIVRERVPEKVAALQALAAAQPADSWRARALVAGIGPGAAAAVPTAAVARILTPAETARVTAGAAVYQQICVGCHGANGEGVVPSAPPLVNSEWVTGPESRLIRIALQGVSGPISVNGTVRQPPAILPEMPGLAAGLNDDQIASVLTYIRQSWGHNATPLTPAQVATVRGETATLTRPWTPASLLEIR